MGMKHKAKRIAREAGMPNCNPKTGAYLYVTPAPHGFAGNQRLIRVHYADNTYQRALIALGSGGHRRGHRMRHGHSTLQQVARRVLNRWRGWLRASNK